MGILVRLFGSRIGRDRGALADEDRASHDAVPPRPLPTPTTRPLRRPDATPTTRRLADPGGTKGTPIYRSPTGTPSTERIHNPRHPGR